MKPNIIIVLEALYSGVDVEIDGIKFRMQDGKIYQVGVGEEYEEYLLSTDFLSMNDFISLIDKKMTEENRVALIGALVIKKANEMLKKANKR